MRQYERRAEYEVQKRIDLLAELMARAHLTLDLDTINLAVSFSRDIIPRLRYVHYSELAAALIYHAARYMRYVVTWEMILEVWARFKNRSERAKYGTDLSRRRVFHEYRQITELGLLPLLDFEVVNENALKLAGNGLRLPDQIYRLAAQYLTIFRGVKRRRFGLASIVAAIYLAAKEKEKMLKRPITVSEILRSNEVFTYVSNNAVSSNIQRMQRIVHFWVILNKYKSQLKNDQHAETL